MKKDFQRLKQPTPEELTNALLDFLRRKFYTRPQDVKAFAQDRSRLLAWVVLWPASWLNSRGVTIHGDAYRDIFFKVFLNADAHRSDRIKYRPAWLRMVIQSHFEIHGEEYYQQAKSVRSITERLVLLGAASRQAAPDPIGEMSAARSILKAGLAQKRAEKAASQKPVKDQLSLF